MKKKWIYSGIIVGVLLIGLAVIELGAFGVGGKNILPASVVPVTPPDDTTPPHVVDPTPVAHYIEIMGGCDWSYTGTCVNARSGPGINNDVVHRLRIGIVLKVEADTTPSDDGHIWYKVIQDKTLWHPERITTDWYVADNQDFVRVFTDPGEVKLDANTKPVVNNKRIVVNLGEEMLYAYDGDALFMQESISTGIGLNPTVAGKFSIFRKTPSRYMQGPLPDGDVTETYDLPGVAWDMYFTADGAVLHAAYWHNNFGHPMSHGCVNQLPENAKKLYDWADLGTPVTVIK